MSSKDSADGSRASRRNPDKHGTAGYKTHGPDESSDVKKLRAHQQERVPAPPPVDGRGNARTVLAGKGSLRRAHARPCLLCSVLGYWDQRRAAPAGTRCQSGRRKKQLTLVGLLMEVLPEEPSTP